MSHRKPSRALALVIGLAGCWLSRAATLAAEPRAEDIEFFESRVRPVLATRCFKCHGVAEPKGKLRLDSRAGMLQGGETGPALVPGKPSESLLIDAINHGTYQMPPDGKLKPEEIAAITQWVARGAPWPPEHAPAAAKSKNHFDLAERAKHWSLQPVRHHSPPAVQDTAWPKTALDRFLLARLERVGLRPAADADRATWLRRVTFALTGLPPEPNEIDAFETDRAEEAYEKVVDRLLQSPHFGERWGRHWLDLVRYAESRGHEFDYDIPNACQYRDYVIRALNADVPYDQFVIEHIAGDLLERPRLNPREGFNESILGTGFWFLGEWVHSPVDVRLDEAERFDNMIDVMTKTFLGLTVACARCHDHKFDAISQADYYALYGYLRSSEYRQVCFDTLEHNRRVAAGLAELRRRSARRLAGAIVAGERSVISNLAKYLIAARDASLRGAAKDLDEKARQAIAQIARGHGLSAEVLRHWVVNLGRAHGDATDPFHAWARVAWTKDADRPGRIAEVLSPLLSAWRQQVERADAALRDAKIIIDYADPGAEFWQDGFTFGESPIRPGDLFLPSPLWGERPGLRGASNKPLIEIATYGAVRRDVVFAAAKLAPGTQTDGGRLAGWHRSGRTFRTPTFTIETGQVFYLVAGPGRAYAAVDSHRMNNGPLHGEFLQQWKADASQKPRWIAHPLKLYKGHRCHLEFTPEGDADLQVLMVVQAEKAPGDSLDRPNRLLMEMLTDSKNSASPEALARAYGDLFARVADKLAGGGGASAPAEAPLASWLVTHHYWLSLAGAADERKALDKLVGEFSEQHGKLVRQVRHESRAAPAMWDGPGQDERLFIRGNPKTLGPVVPRRFLEALGGKRSASAAAGSGRLELARRMTDPEHNPLITRVIVNRVWHHLFGRGIVESVDNFGVLGKSPTHPELLDYLAESLAADGWSLKRLIRRIVLSRAYRMSSDAVPHGNEVDPNNLLLHRMNVRRLEAEAIRDAMLAVSGRLDRTKFGSSVPVHLTEFMQGRGRPSESGPIDGRGRRSLYISVRRNFLSPTMLAFDMPIPFTTMGRRNVSNVPAQALMLMNDPLVAEQSMVWAKRVLAAGGLSPAERITAMYRAAFARRPTHKELAQAEAFLRSQAGEYGLAGGAGLSDPRPWADLAHVLFNVKEFVFVR